MFACQSVQDCQPPRQLPAVVIVEGCPTECGGYSSVSFGILQVLCVLRPFKDSREKHNRKAKRVEHRPSLTPVNGDVPGWQRALRSNDASTRIRCEAEAVLLQLLVDQSNGKICGGHGNDILPKHVCQNPAEG